MLKPLLEVGWLEMTIPDKPTSSKQKYRLTTKGRDLLAGLDGGQERPRPPTLRTHSSSRPLPRKSLKIEV